MRLLCTGDLHLGRRSSRVSAADVELSARAVWVRIVARAIEERVDALLLSGDVVDAANRYFEAVGPLERGLLQLREAGIPVVAVAGNHDFDILPALARALPDGALHLLGVGGQWERHTLTSADGQRVHVDGWSFASRHAPDDPLARYQPHASDGTPAVGLLHTDLDVRGSLYAPTTRDALRAQPTCCWVLGHVHAGGHRERPGDPPVLYPGSPQPLDPGESGAHGCWVVDVSPSGAVSTRLLPVATVRYDTLTVDVSHCTERQEVRDAVRSTATAWANETLVDAGDLAQVVLRVALTGRTALHGTLDALAGELAEWTDVVHLVGATASANGRPVGLSVSHSTIATRGRYELAELAERRDAIGWLARLLHDVEARGSEAVDTALWRTLREIPGAVERSRPHQGTDLARTWDDAALVAAVSGEAERLLDTLLRQTEVSA